MTFGEQYPEKPPRVRFTSEVFHPNVYSDGTLCMDIIQDQWSPIHNVCTLLTSIQSLLTDPNPASPANPERHSCSRRTRADTTAGCVGWRRRRSKGEEGGLCEDRDGREARRECSRLGARRSVYAT